MRTVLAIVLSILLMTETVYAKPSDNHIVYTEEVQALEETEAEDAGTQGPQVSAPSAILVEKTTGTVIYEKDADTARPPASVTKIMTMLLIFDTLESGKIKLQDQVTVSEFASSMGGSQVYLEPGETQTVETMLKCISVASANDACGSFKSSRRYFVCFFMQNLLIVC